MKINNRRIGTLAIALFVFLTSANIGLAKTNNSHRIENNEKIEKLKEKAINQNDASAQYDLDILLSKEGKIEEAKKWCIKSAEQGYPPAQFNLGLFLLEEGKLKEAEIWFRKVSDKGFESLILDLKNLANLDGKKITRNLKDSDVQQMVRDILTDSKNKKIIKLKKVAEQGDAGAKNELGFLLEKEGKIAGAELWYRESALQNYSIAQNNLADLLVLKGESKEAKYWYKKAAEQDFLPAQFNLGRLLYGEGRIKESKKWFTIAASKGNKEAKQALKILEK